MDIINRVREFVEEKCKEPSSRYGYEPFNNHFVPAIDYANKLIKKLNKKKPNREIILIAVWFHDIGSIIHGRKDHHITGAKIAEEKLKEFKYPIKKIELVKKCILNHRGSQQNKRITIEEKIVAEADTLSNFDNLAGIFKAAFVYENKTQDEAKRSVREKLERKYRQLHFNESKVLISPKMKAVRLLLK